MSDITVEPCEELADFFKAKLADAPFNDKLIIKAVKRIRQCHGNISIEKLSHEFCYSQKQFNRRFKEYDCFNPKLFARIIRFESALKNCGSHTNLTGTAYDYGYYDQAHFVRDFKIFAGYSPNKFFELSGN